MFVERKSILEKDYAYPRLLSFKTLVTYIIFLTSQQSTMSVVKRLSSEITRVFSGHCPMSGANIQACT